MALFGLFDYCKDCGALMSKKKLDKNNRCGFCASRVNIKSLPQQQAAPCQPTMAESIINTYRSQPDEIPARGNIYAGAMNGDCALVYRYPNVSVSDVNRSIMKDMHQQNDYRMDLSISESGEVLALKGGQAVAKIEDQAQMCIDWIRKQQPVICEFAYFTEGKEKVALFFYRNEAAKMEGHQSQVVKLTGCFSEEKQETIAFLEKGQKLFVELDDNDKPYVRDIWYNPIGRLPAKINRLHEEERILGLYFDHSETKESEDFEKEDREIPYIKIYFE